MISLPDMLHLILARWASSKRVVILTLLNLVAGLTVLASFVTVFVNLNVFLSGHYLNSPRTRHVMVVGNGGARVPLDASLLQDSRLVGTRLIYDTHVPVRSVSGSSHADEAQLALTVMQAGGLVFPGESDEGSVFAQDGSDWRSGVVVSSRLLTVLGPDPIGQVVDFAYLGRDYSLPITAVISATAEDTYDTSYMSTMYVLAPALTALPMDAAMADVLVSSTSQVASFVASATSSGVRCIADTDDAKRLAGLAWAVSVVLLTVAMMFVVLSAVGVASSLQAMLEERRPGLSLQKVLGFPRRALTSMALVEAALLVIAGLIPTLMIVVGLMSALRRSKLFSLPLVSASDLFAPNVPALGLAALASFVLVGLCQWVVYRKVHDTDLIDWLRDE